MKVSLERNESITNLSVVDKYNLGHIPFTNKSALLSRPRWISHAPEFKTFETLHGKTQWQPSCHSSAIVLLSSLTTEWSHNDPISPGMRKIPFTCMHHFSIPTVHSGRHHYALRRTGHVQHQTDENTVA